jgi:hypothetical protein
MTNKTIKFSDRRLKENIVLLGQVAGFNVYSYNYLGKTTTEIGVIAQELLETEYAHAVKINDAGFYQVNYMELPDLELELGLKTAAKE